MNHLALTLGVEEKDVTTLSIRPGMVDTAMQQELRDQHLVKMDPDAAEKFSSTHRDGKLLRPEQPGTVIAKLALNAPKELSGQFLQWVFLPETLSALLIHIRWNDEVLKDFQE